MSISDNACYPLPATDPFHFAVLIGDRTIGALKGASAASKQLTVSSAARAFRATQIVDSLPQPLMNRAGNLRGVVVSKQVRTIFTVSSNVSRKFAQHGSALALAGMIIELAKDSDSIAAIWNSDLSSDVKARKFTLIASTAILRSVTGVVPTGATILAKALEGYVMLADTVTAGRFPALQEWVGNIRAMDVAITATHRSFNANNVEAFSEKLGAEAYDLIELTVNFSE